MTVPFHGSADDRRRAGDRREAGGPAVPDWGAEVAAESRSTDRFVTFSDAVVAIAITLLALDLPVPIGRTNGVFLTQLRHDWTSYLAFLISFLVVANHWSTHRQIFRYVCRLNSRVAQLNMAWLLLVVLTPFATKIVTGGGQLGVRFTVYALIQVIATGCAFGMSREVRTGHLLRADAPASARHADPAPYVAFIVVFLASIPVAFVAGSWAFALWALSPRLSALLRRTHAVDRFAADDSV